MNVIVTVMCFFGFFCGGAITEEQAVIETGNLNSTHALLVEAESGRVLMEKNSAARMYPASMTKIMTALVALEHVSNLDELVFLDPAMFPELWAQNAMTAGFAPGQWVSMRDLLFGLMLPSGAECAIGIANHVAGGVEGFVVLMNEKADQIELHDTQFTNPIGLHHPHHFTTATDMVTLLQFALEQEGFRELFTTPIHNGMESTLFANLPRTWVNQGEIIGGRTGFTLEAGRCLISLAKINGREYILVTGGAVSTPEHGIGHLEDALYVFDQL